MPDHKVTCEQDLEYAFAPESTALLVIDMQRDFLDDDGMCSILDGDCDALQAIRPAVASLTASAREAGLHVIHTREGYAADLSDVHQLKRDRNSVGVEGPLGRFLVRGEPGHDFSTGFEPRDGEWVIDKPGFSAFYSTDLDKRLRKKGVTHLVVCGVTTQCCVLSTVRSAVDRGYYCLTVTDACAAIDPSDHEAALATIRAEGSLFGWLTTVAGFRASL